MRETELHRWRWTPGKVYHWVLSYTAVAYAFWRFGTSEEKKFLLEYHRSSFKDSPFGLEQKQDAVNWEWQTTKYVMATTWKWYLLHPVLARATAYLAPSYMYKRYGLMPYMAAYVTFHWNILRGLSFSVEYVQAECQRNTGDRQRRFAPYWKTLGYLLYLPTVYLGPPQRYDDYVAQLDKPRPSCTPRVIAAAIARLLRSGAHFLLMELMGHFFYGSAMSQLAWMGESLDLASLAGYALSLEFDYYVCYLFTYGFAGALSSAEGIEVPETAPCIARLHRCSRFWRYFDRGMHLFIRRYIYEPVLGGTRSALRLVLCTAVAFSFTCTWHNLYSHEAVWCALSLLGIALEVITIELRKWTPVKNFEGRYLASAERMRVAKALLGSPHFLLTICACLFHLAELEVCLVICRRILTGFPFPLVPILVVMYSLCNVSMDVAEWEASAIAKKKLVSL
ncbi:protein-cysteine N-palmitoyltransferase HHAT-like isoform X5 [Dermacentor silvarum]|uniref:protein-cysteine N-palmitoyltransferase HHAT-like isoform X5 n=1 Tax=Dermacentor silvarum TaxID=543639 RepID=UPI0021013766|nr:protein-cysteine N-palmitoyltransferase HHAT-like isoform X5 [Dermacentor silvarum]